MFSITLRHVNQLFCVLCLLLSNVIGNSRSEDLTESLPFCGITESSDKYIFVSTLDGRVTALNPDDGGSVVWSIHPGSEPMLSSSIHKLELTNYGHLVRMIPSLSGGLYKFNGENIEAIPVTADNLLQASFRYSDDLVISGGKESQTFGVSLHSGKILYECSMKGCGNESQAPEGDILVIQRLGQVVRAVEPRSGSERWNFSVAQHDMKLLSECHGQQQPALDYALKVIVPEGLVCAVDVKNPTEVIWKHKFSSPVVSAWQILKGKLLDIDLFSGSQSGPMDLMISPSLYIGMHDKQLYIQESVMMLKKRQELASKFGQHLITNENSFPRIPWKPVVASSTGLGLIEEKSEEEGAIDEVSQRQTTALSVLYASAYVEGNGFYLYTEDALEKTRKGLCNVTIGRREDESDVEGESQEEFSEEETPVQIVIVSLWYWWREVIVISLTTAVVFNLMFTRRFIIWKSRELTNVVEQSKTYITHKGSDSGIDVHLEKVPSASESHLGLGYSSRYLADFDHVKCLGKGGFGVVFEAKNKIDDCHYAIKRIVLPSSQESRDRVMREVRALAKLDHHHIVRYFNTWTECPPAGWQEKQDSSWIHLEGNSDDLFCTTGATHSSHIPVISHKSSVFLDLDSDISLSGEGPKPVITNEISDSFIVFESDSGHKEASQRQSIITVSSEDEEESEESKIFNGCVASKVQRPTSLYSGQHASPPPLSPARVYLYIQMQLCQPQSLKDWLSANKLRDYDYVIKIFGQILQAVEYVHLNSLIHRDLKPSNIFFSLDDQIKIGDFGLVTAMTEGDRQLSPTDSVKVGFENEKHTAQVGTQLYMSPEQLNGEPYSYKVDIYSLGLILYELLVPFDTDMERITLLQNIKQNRFTESFQKQYKSEHELLKLMLSWRPDERPTTYGIRARLPLSDSNASPSDKSWHFDLPPRHRSSSKTSRVSTSSNDGNTDSR